MLELEQAVFEIIEVPVRELQEESEEILELSESKPIFEYIFVPV